MFQAEAGGREEPCYGTRNSSQKKTKNKKNCWGDVDADGVALGAGDRAGQGRAAGRGIEVSGLGLQWANMQPNSSLF